MKKIIWKRLLFKILPFFFLALSGMALANTKSMDTGHLSIGKPSEIVNYNLFLIPDVAFQEPLDQIVNHLSKAGLRPLLKEGYLPHITLYLTEYPKDKLIELKQQAKLLANNWKSFKIIFTKIEQTKGNWLLWNIKYNSKLQRLADEATMRLSPYRNLIAKLPAWVNQYPNKKLSFQRYGSPNVFAQFQPHITLMPSSDPQKLSYFMNSYGKTLQPIQIKVIGVGIAEDNANGQSKKIIAKYIFKK